MPVVVKRPGPWTHRDLTAGDTRFHVAMAGPETPPPTDPAQADPPLILLVHGFPECWWAWRHVIGPLAQAGYRVAALDLRGFGGSDRPPSGYDLITLAEDLERVVPALGHERAVVVGAGLGGQAAWALAGIAPGLLTGIVPVGAPHPLAVRSLRGRAFSGTALQYLSFKVPLLPERSLRTRVGMERLLRSWTGPRTRRAVVESAGYYASLLARPGAARSAMEPVRHSVLTRAEIAALAKPVSIPVLSIQGQLDPVQPAQAYARDTHHVAGPLQQVTIHDVGHFPHEEAPDKLTAALLPFLAETT
ncbi:alpha/beta fold hydrolase [Actinomyces oricola]|uniref:alpha/beta fold hydrolase n=1 Tax=Actinomyces oricola TaxID=206043 RepID=UPI000FFEDF50|nr:alpha/beta hydrolase [Actinomyces oricola]